jgi:hypothetical protein
MDKPAAFEIDCLSAEVFRGEALDCEEWYLAIEETL